MLHAYSCNEQGLRPLPVPAPDISAAIWIDLLNPDPEQVAEVEALGLTVPGLEDMEEIQLSSRLYRVGQVDYVTVVLAGPSPDGRRIMRPVCFILGPERLVTVRYHAPETFGHYPTQGGHRSLCNATPGQVAMGLVEDIVDHLADALEDIGRRLDDMSQQVFDRAGLNRANLLQKTLENAGVLGERIGRLRLSLLTLERALNYVDQFPGEHAAGYDTKKLARGQARDIAALAVHADFLSSRVTFLTDATLGLIDLEQNKAVSMLSALVALFAPATLISSIYGMNFAWMPELHSRWGFAFAIALMIVSAGVAFLYFKRRGWL
ncbi:CorA family divalent cation transporter [Tropicimonas sp.]|uniref:CorA family divalent cation transporter n=1 Tax=Tropicimonas sp. TaxID=2067044 RepID=UPI003A87F5DE